MIKATTSKPKAQSVDIIWFDWKEADVLVRFIQDMTATTPMCFRQVETGGDCWVLVFSERPVSQREADDFYRQTIGISQTAKRKNK